MVFQRQCLDNLSFGHVRMFFCYSVPFKAYLPVSPVNFKVGGAGDVEVCPSRKGNELLRGLLS